MNWIKKNLFGLFVFGLVLAALVVGSRAQVPNSPYSFTVGPATHTSCPAVATGVTIYCFPSDGIWVSLAGAAYVQIASNGVVTGVVSFNGRTGAVVPVASDYAFSQISGVATSAQVPVPPVISVNNKTGAVVLGASTTIQ